MADNDEFLRFLASWALVHETADEGWKAAVARGRDQEPGLMGSGPDAFVDGLSAVIAERTERLKAQLASGVSEPSGSRAEVGERLDELHFEVAEMRGRLETLQASLDALLDRTPARPGAAAPARPPAAASAATAEKKPKPATAEKPVAATAPAPEPDATAAQKPGDAQASQPAEPEPQPDAEPAGDATGTDSVDAHESE